MKVLFQEVCQSKLGWDDLLLYRKLQRRYDELRKVGYIEIPRRFLNNNSDGPVSYQLHEFCDSSSGAMQPLPIRESKPKFVLHRSKTRVAPLSKISIPRLELLSTLILARLMAKVV